MNNNMNMARKSQSAAIQGEFLLKSTQPLRSGSFLSQHLKVYKTFHFLSDTFTSFHFLSFPFTTQTI